MIRALVEFLEELAAPPPDAENSTTRAEYEQELHKWRARNVRRRRKFVDGRQYDAQNLACWAAIESRGGGASFTEKMIAAGYTDRDDMPPLPEHVRMHPYSGALSEGIDFLASRLADGFGITAVVPDSDEQDDETPAEPGEDDEKSRAVVVSALELSPVLGGRDEQQLRWSTVLRDACLAGDVAVYLRWQPDPDAEGGGSVVPEFEPSETVQLHFSPDRSRVVKAIKREDHWLTIGGDIRLVTVRREWEVRDRTGTDAEVPLAEMDDDDLAALMTDTDTDTGGGPECVETWIMEAQGGREETVLREVSTRLPFVPWWPLRAKVDHLNSVRGDSVITDMALSATVRLDVLLNYGFTIARANTHASIAVAGDAQVLAEKQGKVFDRGVFRVATFPGGTDIEPVTLPSDPQMYDRQERTLLDQIAGQFGLARVDQSKLEGLGDVTGYALEILNQASNNTFSRLQRQLGTDMQTLCNLILDATAWWRASTASQIGATDQVDPMPNVDPITVFPGRGLEVHMGSGVITDVVMIRDHVVAGLLSRRTGLRLMGFGPREIARNEQELAAQRSQQAQADRVLLGTDETQQFTPSTRAGRVARTATDRDQD